MARSGRDAAGNPVAREVFLRFAVTTSEVTTYVRSAFLSCVALRAGLRSLACGFQHKVVEHTRTGTVMIDSIFGGYYYS